MCICVVSVDVHVHICRHMHMCVICALCEYVCMDVGFVCECVCMDGCVCAHTSDMYFMCVYVCVVCVWVRVYRAVMHMCMHADECGMS